MKTEHSVSFTDGKLGNQTFKVFKDSVGELPTPKRLKIIEKAFRMTGYSQIREQVKGIDKIEILIGIDTSEVYRKFHRNLYLYGSAQTGSFAKLNYSKEFIEELAEPIYHESMEESISLLCQDIADGKTEVKIHPTYDLKTNLCLIVYTSPTASGDQLLGIVGNGNLSHVVFKAPSFSFNRVIFDNEPLQQLNTEFDTLWKQALAITSDDIQSFLTKTHLGQTPKPFDIYMKVLIDYFGSQVENSYSWQMPQGFKKLKYQIDAVAQGYDMLLRHNGFFLSDVVGLGKTVVAAMTSNKFIDANGIRNTKILVIYPPNNEDNWKSTFERFGLLRHTQFVSFGSLNKLYDPTEAYWDKEDYDIVFIDEAHKSRNDLTNMFDNLQRVCKAGRKNIGGVKGNRKKIVLVTATPLNNTPEDIYNLLRLFQDVRNSTISGVVNLQKYFTPKIAEYKQLMRERGDLSKEEQMSLVERINNLYEPIRREVIDQVTVRRTRENLMNNSVYREDLERQGITFPIIERPININYLLEGRFKDLFGQTMYLLTEKVKYARYRAIERFTEEHRHKYPQAEVISRTLGTLFRTRMVKRLESSFLAFRNSLKRLMENTELMIEMFDRNEVIIAPELRIKVLADKGWSLDEIIEEGIDKLGFADKSEFVYPANAFDPDFLSELREDAECLRKLHEEWSKIEGDPKLDAFVREIKTRLLNPDINPEGKLVIFSESTETVTYLTENLKRRLEREDILSVSSKERSRLQDTILANFDANYNGEQKNDYNILITTDTLAESVNLHRANIILHYDTPWNAILLMQRNGRVNRIGSTAKSILNFLFYPSTEGNEQIKLYQNALAKLQGFHSAYGEDMQIFSVEEVVKQFELFNPRIGDDEDLRGVFLNELREFFNDYPKEYERIRNLPRKSRVQRPKQHNQQSNTLVYIASEYKSGYYLADVNEIKELTFLEAAALLKTGKDETSINEPFAIHHYRQASSAYDKYLSEITEYANNSSIGARDKDPKTAEAAKYIRTIRRSIDDQATKEKFDRLTDYIEQGIYAQLIRDVNRLKNRKTDTVEAIRTLTGLYEKYHTDNENDSGFVEQNYGLPYIVLSETFI